MARQLLRYPSPAALRRPRENTVQNPDPLAPIADSSSPGVAPIENSANEHASDNEMIGFDRLAFGMERIGGMGVRSAQVPKVLKTRSHLPPYQPTPLISTQT